MTSQVSHFDVHCGMLGPELLDSGAVEGVAVGEVEEGEVWGFKEEVVDGTAGYQPRTQYVQLPVEC